MKVVINIPEDDYKLACDYPDALIACYAHYIKAGVPLPKKHGRIADMDEAIKCIEEVTGKDAEMAINLIEWACGKRTIIEAEEGDVE